MMMGKGEVFYFTVQEERVFPSLCTLFLFSPSLPVLAVRWEGAEGSKFNEE